MCDRNFDDLVDKFDRHIYGSFKGDIRQAVLWQDLSNLLPCLPPPPLRVLDAGGGMGQLSQRLASLGHQVLLCDISSQMLQRARAEAQASGVSPWMRFLHCSIQEITNHLDQPANLVICHAVLEWMVEPRTALQILANCLAPGGIISLMFYNLHGLLLRNLLLGNFQHVAAAMPKRCQRSLRPNNPLEPEQVEFWLSELNLTIIARSGVRVLSDYWHKSVHQQLDRATVIALEQRYCRQMPFINLGRYIHLMAQKANSPT